MGRPIFTFELSDPDFAWLISNFKESHPQYNALESSSLPVVFISSVERSSEAASDGDAEFEVPPTSEAEDKARELSDRKVS